MTAKSNRELRITITQERELRIKAEDALKEVVKKLREREATITSQEKAIDYMTKKYKETRWYKLGKFLRVI
jgi:ElaB/YqjD/DUF883 family membrane-anchored ribosome-binding protein